MQVLQILDGGALVYIVRSFVFGKENFDCDKRPTFQTLTGGSDVKASYELKPHLPMRTLVGLRH